MLDPVIVCSREEEADLTDSKGGERCYFLMRLATSVIVVHWRAVCASPSLKVDGMKESYYPGNLCRSAPFLLTTNSRYVRTAT